MLPAFIEINEAINWTVSRETKKAEMLESPLFYQTLEISLLKQPPT